MKRSSANDTTAEDSTPNVGAQGGKMDVRGWDAPSPPALPGHGELVPDKQGAVAKILGECETSGGSVSSGPRRSTSNSSKDVISFVHTGSDVTDVIRSGIVSRILASVSGREANDSSAGLELHSSPGQTRSPSRFKISRLRAKPEFADVVLDTMKEKRKLQTQKVFPKVNPKFQKFDLDSSVDESSTSAGRLTTVHSSHRSHSATSTITENSPSAEPVRGATEGYSQETPMSKGASPSGEERKSERLTSIPSGHRSDRKHSGRHVTTLDVNSKTNKTVGHPATSQVKPLRSSHVSGESFVHTQSSSSSDKQRNTSSVRAKKKASSEIPQSLSTDSGIGSPTDVTGGVELIGNAEGVVNRTGPGETPEDSSSMQLVSPVPSHKSPNYLPCGDPSDCSPSSNYHPLLAASGWSSFPGTQRGADGSNSRGVDPVVDDVTSGVSGPKDSLHRDNCDKSQPLVNTDLPCSCRHSDSSTVGASSAPSHASNISLQPEVNDIPPPFISPESVTASSRDATPNDATDAQINGIKTHTSRRYSRPSITETNLELVADLIHDDTVAGFAVNAFLKTILNNQTHGNRIHGSEDLNPQTGLNADKATDSVDQVDDGGADKVRRVEFHPEAAGVDKTAPEKPVRKIPTFRDVNLRDVISLTEESPSTDRKLKGILKSTSVPTLSSAREINPVRNGAVRPDLVSSRSVSFNKLHTKNTFSYYNAAFEGEIITEPSKRPSLADVVSHIMRQGSIIEMEDDNSHPYGRDTSLTDLITGKRRDSYNMDAGKMIVWLVLAIMIVSLAGGIIFMSETYNMNHKNDDISTTVETTTLTKLYR